MTTTPPPDAREALEAARVFLDEPQFRKFGYEHNDRVSGIVHRINAALASAATPTADAITKFQLYAGHLANCPAEDGDRCACGFSDALAALATPAPAPGVVTMPLPVLKAWREEMGPIEEGWSSAEIALAARVDMEIAAVKGAGG